MKILLFCPSSAGLLNHAIALTKLLQKGDHEVAIVSGPEAAQHFSFLGQQELLTPSPSHSLQFGPNRTSHVGHVEQICQPQYLRNAIESEIELFSRFKPDLIIIKNYFSAIISAQKMGISWASYLTGGAPHLFSNHNPISNLPQELSTQIVNAAHQFGVNLHHTSISKIQISPYLNIIRGIPEISGLSEEELRQMPITAKFVGALTYDGNFQEPANKISSWSSSPHYKIYVTFGTANYSLEPYRAIREELLSRTGTSSLITVPNQQLDLSQANSVLTARYVPNDYALKFADAIVHHGGYGTTLSAICHKKPQIVIPQNRTTSCQEMQGAIIQKLGLGAMVTNIDSFKDELNSLLNESLARRFESALNYYGSLLVRETERLQVDFLNELRDGF